MWWIVGAVLVVGLMVASGAIRRDLRRRHIHVDMILADERRREQREPYDWRPWALQEDRRPERWRQ